MCKLVGCQESLADQGTVNHTADAQAKDPEEEGTLKGTLIVMVIMTRTRRSSLVG